MEKEIQTAVSKEEADKAASRMAMVGIVGNIVLSAFKLVAGLAGHSAAMISDAVHSLSDVFATAVAFVGVRMSSKGADEDHPYGHERIESVASIMLAAILAVTGAGIGYSCLQSILTGDHSAAEVPGRIALIAAIVSIVTKEGMFQYTMREAKRVKSSAFQADAWHHRSDALSSVGALVGIAGARMGFPVLDKVAGIVICLVILYVAYEICTDALSKMMDTACDPEFEKGIRECVETDSKNRNIPIGIDMLHTRKFGEKAFVDMEISLDGDMRLKDAHDIAEQLHDEIEDRYPNIKHIMIHMNPAGYGYKVPKM